MAKIGSETKPVYVGANGDARPCDLELHDISVENKGDNEVIAIIKIDNVPYEIKNIKQGGTAFSVTFKDWNGTVLKTEAVLKGGNATPPTNPTREGYDFKSWSGTYTNVQADQVVTATYQIKTFTVIFRQLKDGTYTTLKTQTGVQWGTAATAPDKPSVTGYNTSDWDKTFTSIKADTTVTCTLTKKTYTITFKNNGGTVLQSKSWNYGDTPSYGSTPTAENQDPSKTYTFTGWSPTITTVTADATYTAQYSTAVKTKTVTFKLDGGNISGSTADVVRTVNYGTAYTSVTKPDNPTKTGYNFTGWGDPVPASAINASGQVIDNCVSTAQYESAIFTVRFYTKEKTLIKEYTDVVKDTDLSTFTEWNNPPTWTGHEFRNWGTLSGSTLYPISGKVTSNLDLYADYNIYWKFHGTEELTSGNDVVYQIPASYWNGDHGIDYYSVESEIKTAMQNSIPSNNVTTESSEVWSFVSIENTDGVEFADDGTEITTGGSMLRIDDDMDFYCRYRGVLTGDIKLASTGSSTGSIFFKHKVGPKQYVKMYKCDSVTFTHHADPTTHQVDILLLADAGSTVSSKGLYGVTLTSYYGQKVTTLPDDKYPSWISSGNWQQTEIRQSINLHEEKHSGCSVVWDVTTTMYVEIGPTTRNI